jgi:hypothetical protein
MIGDEKANCTFVALQYGNVGCIPPKYRTKIVERSETQNVSDLNQ